MMDTPGPVSKRSQEAWYGGPGLVQNMEQIALLHGNPTPIFNMPVDWSLLGERRSKDWVKIFGQDNDRFQQEFAKAWKKVTSAGWDQPQATRAIEGWSGGELNTCKRMPCSAAGGKFFCPVDLLTDRLRYLPKPAAAHGLELGECIAAEDSSLTDGIPEDSELGACNLVGGFGVRGTVECGTKKYHCCSPRACAWETWLKAHREADKSDEPTCAFTEEEKQREVERTKQAWMAAADSLPARTLPKAKDIGVDMYSAQNETIMRLLAHEKQAKQWYFPKFVDGTLPKEMKDIPGRPHTCPQQSLSALVAPTAGTMIGNAHGRISGASLDMVGSGSNSGALYKPF